MTSILDGEYAGATHNPEAAAALRPVLTSRALSRCRVLTVVCPNGHALVQVIRTTRGLVVTGDAPVDRVRHLGRLPGAAAASHSTHTTRLNRATTFCLFYDDLVNLSNPARPYTMMKVVQCRCRSEQIQPWELSDYIGSRRRRVVHVGVAQR